MANYGIGSVLTPKTRPITAEYERGYESTLGRHCRTKGCPSDMAKEPAEALWCAQCKAEDVPPLLAVMKAEHAAKVECIADRCEALGIPAEHAAQVFGEEVAERMERR